MSSQRVQPHVNSMLQNSSDEDVIESDHSSENDNQDKNYVPHRRLVNNNTVTKRVKPVTVLSVDDFRGYLPSPAEARAKFETLL